MISQAVSEGRHGGHSPLTRRPRRVRALNAPVVGVGAGAVDPRGPRAKRGPARGCAQPSSEAESRPRGHPALEGGGVSPRGRPALERGGFRPRGRPALERGGVSPRGGVQPSSEAEFRPRGTSPRARRGFARGGIQPSSEVEFRLRGRPALERGGVSVVRCRVPQARRSFARGVPGPAA
jgi:hypothetical protein